MPDPVVALSARFRSLYPAVPMRGESHTEDRKDNLFVDPETVRAEFESSRGDEWPSKIFSVRSSAALAVNLFAPLRETSRGSENPSANLLGVSPDWRSLSFEEKLRVGLGSTDASLDALVACEAGGPYEAIAVETKVTEYFVKKHAPEDLSDRYDELLHLRDDTGWSAALDAFRSAPGRHLDRKQLLTHAAGLLNRRRRLELVHSDPPTALLALFWFPADAAASPACREVMRGAAEWADMTAGSPVPLRFATVADVTAEWLASPDSSVREHASHIADRYCGISLREQR